MSENIKQLKSYKILVKGVVQGVGYRQFVCNAAQRYGIKGWAKNLISGDVEIQAYGNKQQIQVFIDSLYQGPSGAKVGSLHVEQTDYKNFESFEIKS